MALFTAQSAEKSMNGKITALYIAIRAAQRWKEGRTMYEELKLKGDKTMDSNKYFIVRADRAGVFFGHIKDRTGDEVTMIDVRRLWYWEGAASLSQLAVDGTSRPCACKFTVTVPETTILGVIEIIPCSDKAASSILGVKEWRA